MKRILLMLSATVIAITSFASASLAEGDAVKGETVFKKCKACHTVDNGGKNLVGPNLFGIVGKKSAIHEGYNYSDAMKAANLTWDEATLDSYLSNPKTLVPKTKMTFVGLKKDTQRADVIAYLKTLQ